MDNAARREIMAFPQLQRPYPQHAQQECRRRGRRRHATWTCATGYFSPRC